MNANARVCVRSQVARRCRNGKRSARTETIHQGVSEMRGFGSKSAASMAQSDHDPDSGRGADSPMKV
jgi:hypothetical protein